MAGERLWVKGVTYGTFAPGPDGSPFGHPEQVESDFAAMAASGVNAVRTYVVPPPWVLDAALRHGLWVMAGLAWEQHVTFLDSRRRTATIEAAVREQLQDGIGHPAILCFAVGNEIPTPIVRWHGRRRVEAFIARLCSAVREADPHALLTYVNYPSTEYLRLPFLDFVSFNLYLDEPAAVARYLARLQNLAGDKPLLLAELGADSRAGGDFAQAEAVSSQLEAVFDAGCAGAFVFSWTDEWHRGDDEVVGWDFGVTDRHRAAKPALRALERTFRRVGQARTAPAPVSVVVCTHNGEATLRECLEGTAALRYPDYEVIVVDDGSTDASADIAAKFDVRLIQIDRRGLSAARNVGLAAARGEIVAFLDDDAWPDPDWLRFLDHVFRSTAFVAVGGPNLPPRDEGSVATCVANAPGGPVHVLLSDTEAEHIPGCNMAYRRSELLAVGGFDPQFHTAGDDVDVCWRLQNRGLSLGFHPAAMVWHRRRNSVRAYWRQQRGYGHAEALLERKWPERYNRRGNLTWAGRLYDRASRRRVRPARIYHGTWGTGAFQTEEPRSERVAIQFLRAPDWYLVLGLLASLAALAVEWPFLDALLPTFGAAVAVTVGFAVAAALDADLAQHGTTRRRRARLRVVTALLHLIQPAARLSGRLSYGLAPWRHRPVAGVALPRRLVRTAWHESWLAPPRRVAHLEAEAKRLGARVLRGGPYAGWDLEISGGLAGAARVLMVVEEHGRGRQLTRSRVWPHVSRGVLFAVGMVSTGLLVAVAARSWTFVAGLSAVAACVLVLAAWECGIALAAAVAALETDGLAGLPPVEVDLQTDLRVRLSTLAKTAMEEA